MESEGKSAVNEASRRGYSNAFIRKIADAFAKNTGFSADSILDDVLGDNLDDFDVCILVWCGLLAEMFCDRMVLFLMAIL